MTPERWAVLVTVGGRELDDLRRRLSGSPFAYLLLGPVSDRARDAFAEAVFSPGAAPERPRLAPPGKGRRRVAEADLLERQVVLLMEELAGSAGQAVADEVWRAVQRRLNQEGHG